MDIYTHLSLSIYIYIYMYIYIYTEVDAGGGLSQSHHLRSRRQRPGVAGERNRAVARSAGSLQDSSKGGAVETWCSGSGYIIGCSTI